MKPTPQRVVHVPYALVLLVVLAVLILLVGGTAWPWYFLPQLPSGYVLEYLMFRVAKHECYYWNNQGCEGPHLRDMYLSILCAAIGAITCVVLQALLLIGYAFPIVCTERWRYRLWWPLYATSVAPVVLTIVSWAILFLRPTFLTDDYGQGCNAVRLFGCDFMGPDYGPSLGWLCFVVGSALLSAIALALPFFPSPRPSITSYIPPIGGRCS